MNGDRIPHEGHAKPVGDSRLRSRAFAVMTGGAARSFARTGESRPALGLQRSARTRPARCGRTSRNVNRHGRACRHPEKTRTNNLYNITPKSKDAVVCSFLDSGKWTRTRSEVVSARARTGD